MKRSNQIISLAVLGALSAGAQAGYDPATTVFDSIVRFSGASAVDNLAFDRIDQDLCVNNANKSYFVRVGNSIATGALGNYFGIACDASAASGITGKVLFMKRSDGGSGVGVGPVNSSTAIDFTDRTTCTDADNNNVFTCPGLTPAVPDAGISDVEPKLFEAIPNNGDGTPFTNLESTSPASLVFGIAVNLKFRNALQSAQFGSGHPCVNSEDEKCMPSLTKSQLQNIFSSGSARTNWSWLRVNRAGATDPVNGDPLNTSPATAAYRPAPFSNILRICRRIIGSGSQAQFNAQFLDAPCKNGVGANLLDYRQASTNFGTGPIVWENSGSSDVEKCLQAYDTATQVTANVRDNSVTPTPNLPPKTIAVGINDNLLDGVNGTPENDAQGNVSQYAWAIGILSVEKNQQLTLPYRYIKIDGVAPTGLNVWNGKYWNFAELTCNFRKGESTPAVTFLRAACALNPTSIAKLNIGNDLVYNPLGAALGEHSFGVAGYLAPSTSSGTAAGAAYDITNPVTNYVRFGNNCRAATVNRNNNSGRAPFNTGDTSLDTNGSLNGAGGAIVVDPLQGSSW